MGNVITIGNSNIMILHLQEKDPHLLGDSDA
jgi:hypothetical protein